MPELERTIWGDMDDVKRLSIELNQKVQQLIMAVMKLSATLEKEDKPVA